jgi:hypothetical protein
MVNAYSSIEHLFVENRKTYGYAFRELVYKRIHTYKFVCVYICKHVHVFVHVYITFSNAKNVFQFDM